MTTVLTPSHSSFALSSQACSSSTSPAAGASSSSLSFNEMPSLSDAVKSFQQLLTRSDAPVHLQCIIPTWCPMSGNCLDMHDLHQLRARALLFTHDLLQSLRASGVHATYSLVPSSSTSVSVISARRPTARTAAFNVASISELPTSLIKTKKNVLMLDLDDVPSIVIT
ncbi:hypothetical protein FISHEDRAFT_55710 [Fistulina hepatica ATCC 64428]|uniref:Uncharacterized protein n=1 Tax=Fistulina hepatica ATCC 64428 TaxID=1128425 RepID=A0A0D7AN49_9AGAR|nr:hypothetical protein FISHEDRAFT_55710 [Fistulina hepatica ATCC 64428]